MSEHITEYLSIYLDGELRGRRLRQVEEHLAECRTCRSELQALQSLSALVRDVPVPEFTSSEKFAAQVNLRLPRGLAKGTKSKVQEVGWWLVPIGLLTVWIFISITMFVGNIVSTANEFGLLSSVPAWLAASLSSEAYWSGALGEFGLLSGNTLQWAEMTEAFTRNMLPQITWQGSIALLYLGWIAIWWASHTSQEHGELLEGRGKSTVKSEQK